MRAVPRPRKAAMRPPRLTPYPKKPTTPAPVGAICGSEPPSDNPRLVDSSADQTLQLNGSRSGRASDTSARQAAPPEPRRRMPRRSPAVPRDLFVWGSRPRQHDGTGDKAGHADRDPPVGSARGRRTRPAALSRHLPSLRSREAAAASVRASPIYNGPNRCHRPLMRPASHGTARLRRRRLPRRSTETRAAPRPRQCRYRTIEQTGEHGGLNGASGAPSLQV